jgi:kinesin family protein 5
VFISGVQEVQVKKMEDCLQLLQLGERNRAFAFTQLNAHSSRSHAIVMLTVIKRTKAAGAKVDPAKAVRDTKVKVRED